jgi:hypothetical protein
MLDKLVPDGWLITISFFIQGQWGLPNVIGPNISVPTLKAIYPDRYIKELRDAYK